MVQLSVEAVIGLAVVCELFMDIHQSFPDYYYVIMWSYNPSDLELFTEL
ncbi:4606_t:CDS:2 [Dentiscutata heterogama]|uniref:4606_t:CDS:1 n=1 Tax=Dentiscutata heterogama TaxID=1316150 RepID=A0ACA9KYJ4_9GLOM|nr:4606_t:CDS:2 [Dentiscutata heterogama]